jgi:hypothetical protein
MQLLGSLCLKLLCAEEIFYMQLLGSLCLKLIFLYADTCLVSFISICVTLHRGMLPEEIQVCLFIGVIIG